MGLNADNIAFAERAGDALLDSFIFAAYGRRVESVWRRGQQVVAGGWHIRRADIERRFRAALKELVG